MTAYREDPRLNQSTLKLYLDHEPSIARLMETCPRPPTAAMSLGTWVHKLIETNMATLPIISPYDEYRTKEAKAWKDTNPEALKQDEYDSVVGMAESVLKAFPDIHTAGGKFEAEYYDSTRKALLDYVSPCGKIGFDWKTTSATSLDQFRRDCSKYRYEVQAAWYSSIGLLDEFYFIGVSSTKPHPIFFVKACRASLNHGTHLIKRAMRIRADELSEEKYKLRPLKLEDAVDMWEKQ